MYRAVETSKYVKMMYFACRVANLAWMVRIEGWVLKFGMRITVSFAIFRPVRPIETQKATAMLFLVAYSYLSYFFILLFGLVPRRGGGGGGRGRRGPRPAAWRGPFLRLFVLDGASATPIALMYE